MRSLIVLVSVVFALSLVSFAPASAPPGVNLQAKFEAGQTHSFETVIRSSQKMSAFGSDQTTEAEMVANIELQVLDEEVADGGHALGLVYRHLKLSFVGGQVPGSFDSQDPTSTDAGNVYAEICRPIVDEQIRFIVDEGGTILRIEGLEKLAPDGLAGILFNQLFGEPAAKAMFQPLLKVLDDQQPAQRRPGDSWMIKRPAVPSLGVPESEITLRMTRGDNPRDIAIIELTGEPKAAMPTEATVLPDIETKKSELAGQLRWNGSLGTLESLQTEAISLMESSAQGITITVESTSSTRITRVR